MPNQKPAKTKPKPKAAVHLTAAAVAAPAGSSTLNRVIFCLQPYTSVRPIESYYHVGALCQDLDFLGADLNVEFGLSGNQQYWKGEIDADWSVRYLADYTDLKRKQTP
jgi:hypothetical protein